MKQLITISLLLGTFTLFAQDRSLQSFNIPSESIFSMFQYDAVVKVTIETDLDSLINYRKRNTYQPAKFIYKLPTGEKITRTMKVKPRGKYRRRVCDFPTIKLNFSKKDLKADGMAKYDDYKVVTHCIADKKESKENVLREYLAYKLYNILSPNSYRVHYIEITYVDSKKQMSNLKRTGFLIEDTAELEDRVGGEIMTEPRLPIDSFDLEQYNSVALFQYMIGNLDWRVTPFAKNAKVLKGKETGKYHVIPYDFDFSGLVGVSYMSVAAHLGQKDVRQRIFLGKIARQKDLTANFKYYQAKKTALLDCVDNFDLLSKASRKNIRKYIESFYEDIADGAVNTI